MRRIYGYLMTLMAAVSALVLDSIEADAAAADTKSSSVQTQNGLASNQASRTDQEPESADSETTIRRETKVRRTAGARYWIGLHCLPLSDALRSHLNLDDGQGLIVEQVLKDTAAAKAGIQKHDVLITADAIELTSVADLAQVVERAGKQKNQVALRIVRGGKPQTLTVNPTERKNTEQILGYGARDAIFRYFENFRPGQRELTLRMIRPGIVLDPNLPKKQTQQRLSLPENLSISVTRTGKQPAKIVVSKGNQTWSINEHELGKLPSDIRPFVDRSLRQPTAIAGDRLRQLSEYPTSPRASQTKKQRAVIRSKTSPPLEKRFDEVERQLEALRKAVEKLQKP